MGKSSRKASGNKSPRDGTYRLRKLLHLLVRLEEQQGPRVPHRQALVRALVARRDLVPDGLEQSGREVGELGERERGGGGGRAAEGPDARVRALHQGSFELCVCSWVATCSQSDSPSRLGRVCNTDKEKPRPKRTCRTHDTSPLSSTSALFSPRVSSKVWNSAMRFWERSRSRDRAKSGASFDERGRVELQVARERGDQFRQHGPVSLGSTGRTRGRCSTWRGGRGSAQSLRGRLSGGTRTRQSRGRRLCANESSHVSQSLL
jgi:hypothetical protein